MDYNGISILKLYGEDLTSRNYITDPSIAREEELKKLMLVLLTPEKSGLLVGKAGIGKTAIVEGLAYRINKGIVPNSLLGYRVIKVNSSALIGKMTYNGKEELVISILIEELKKQEKLILFIDEIHTLIGTAACGRQMAAPTSSNRRGEHRSSGNGSKRCCLRTANGRPYELKP